MKGAFNEMKSKLTIAPLLEIQDFKQKFMVERDASSVGVGVMLPLKKEDGKFDPVQFARP